VQQIMGQEDQVEAELEEAEKEIARAQGALLHAQRQKAARSSSGAATATLDVARLRASETRLKEDLVARLRRRENMLAADMATRRARIDLLRADALRRKARFERLSALLSGFKGALVAVLERSNAAVAARKGFADELTAERQEEEAHAGEYADRISRARARVAAAQAASVQAARKSTAVSSDEPEAAEGGDDGPGSGNLTGEQEAAARATITRLDTQIVEQERIIADLHKQTHQLSEVFRTMLTRAGLDSLEQLVERFGEAEAHKYEMYGYVTSMAAEAGSYDEMARDTRAAQAEYVEGLAAAAAAQQDVLTAVRGELAGLTRQAEGVSRERAAVHAVATSVVLELLRVYAAVGGEVPSRLSLLSGSPEGAESAQEGTLLVGREEIISILGDVEQAVSDLSITFASVLRDGSARGLMADGVDGLRARASHADVATLEALHDAIGRLTPTGVEEIKAALHRQPATPAKATSASSASGSAPSQIAIAQLSVKALAAAESPRRAGTTDKTARGVRAAAAGGGAAAVAAIQGTSASITSSAGPGGRGPSSGARAPATGDARPVGLSANASVSSAGSAGFVPEGISQLLPPGAPLTSSPRRGGPTITRL
jgi:hypothetical protein